MQTVQRGLPDSPEHYRMKMMQAGMSYIEHHNQVGVIVYSDICAEYGLQVSKSKWEIASKGGGKWQGW